MKDIISTLSREERLIYELRSIFEDAGYSKYRMSKFEEYDLYSKYKDFLVSENIISFTDTNGKLRALKPDVTLSIVRNTRDLPGKINKFYYDESVYRPEGGSFKEIMQTGLECIGDLGDDDMLEVLGLAVQSLRTISEDCLLCISHPGVISAAADAAGLYGQQKIRALSLIAEKNTHELKALCDAVYSDPGAAEKLIELAALSGAPDEVFDKLAEMKIVSAEVEQLRSLCKRLAELYPADILRVDLSIDCDTRYYSGIVFKGYTSGIPSAVLTGGRYDALLRRMGKSGGAIGFAVYMSMLDRFIEKPETEILNIALPKGRLGEKVLKMFEAAGFECPEALGDSRRLVFTNEKKGVSFFWVKPADVAVYVERGAADIGVCGKDIIMEHDPQVYELLDLKTGKCRMAVAGKADFADDRSRTLIVATKFDKIAADYYASAGRDIDIVHLNGSIELAPILGLSDVIVDIVETGTTLRENDLRETELIAQISARLISNKAAYEFKKDKINAVLEGLRKQVEQ